MRIRSFQLFAVVILMTLISLIAFGCGKQGNRFANVAPTVQITSYEGYDPSNTYTDSTEVTLFQQKIFWHAEDKDGIIAGFAYRVLDNNGVPVSTPGNKYIDVAGDVTPDNVIAKYGKGWVIHYKPGADQDIALDNPNAKRTIWTDKKYAVINFKASTAAGEADTTISSFEIICIDNRGEICEQKAFRRFKSWSAKPICYLSTTKGDPSGGQVGTGIRLSFQLNDKDPFIPSTPWFYEFKLMKCNADSTLIPGTMTNWYSTINSEKVNQYLLTKYTTPGLSNDYNPDGTVKSFTRVIARVTDLAGIISDPDTINFSVREGFHPKTLIYPQRIYALGNNHYTSYIDDSTPEIIPYTIAENEQRFATPYFRATDGLYTAVNSPNLKSWIRWGWGGEYGLPQSNGNIVITDNPYDKKVDVLLDENLPGLNGGKGYYSEITHFDLRLDQRPYYYPPLADSIVTDTNGDRWLRVPVNSSLGQTIVLTNQSLGTHKFEVRAVDLQGEVDPTPAVFDFRIVAPVSKASKDGILVIDDDPHNASFAPEDSIDARYANMLSGYNRPITYIKRHTLEYQDIKNRKIALSDIQQYKFIIYHNDFAYQTSNLPLEHDALFLYLKQGGNMLISGGSNISPMVQAITIARQRFLETYFGINYSQTATGSVTNSFISSPYFVKAIARSAEYNDISLAFDMNLANPAQEDYRVGDSVVITDPNEASFVSLINTKKGLGPVSYFLHYPSATPIFEFRSKPVFQTGYNTAYGFPPNQATYDMYNGKAVGLKKITSNNKCYIVSFPLSLMKKSEAKQFMTTVLSEVMGK